MTREAWSDVYQSSERMMWLSSLIEFKWRKHRLITEFVLLLLLEYQVNTCCISNKRLRSKEIAISNKILL